jgi:predicted nucleotidyltransferase
MGLFEDIHVEARKRGLDFLVIGGLAVIFHGHARDTADLDLLIRRDDRTRWLEVLSQLGYAVEHDRENFVQLSPPKQGAWPVDLMLVAGPSFDPMLAASQEVEMYGVKLRIPALEHLLALKLHALKHGHIGRYSKDLLDVEALVRVNSLDMNSEKMRHLFLKYGSLKIYEQISRFSTGGRSEA